MTNVEVFRPKVAFVYAATVFVFAILLSVQTIYFNQGSIVGLDLSVAATAAIAGWLAWVRPKLELSDEGVRIVNPLRTITIGWHEVQDISTRFSLRFTHVNGRVGVWVAPANGRRRMSRISGAATRSGISNDLTARDLRGVATATFDGESILASDSPISDSGLAAHLVRVRIGEFRTAGATLNYRSKFNWLGASLLAAAAVSCVVFAIVH